MRRYRLEGGPCDGQVYNQSDVVLAGPTAVAYKFYPTGSEPFLVWYRRTDRVDDGLPVMIYDGPEWQGSIPDVEDPEEEGSREDAYRGDGPLDHD